MRLMRRDAFLVAYLLCRSLVRGPEYVDAMTDPKTYAGRGGSESRESSGGERPAALTSNWNISPLPEGC